MNCSCIAGSNVLRLSQLKRIEMFLKKCYRVTMLTEKDKTTIREISKKYSAKRVLLFGSGIDPKIESSDIDIAVEGISHGDFFRYYGELLFALTKPVDVIDLAGTSKFISLIKQEGIPIYG